MRIPNLPFNRPLAVVAAVGVSIGSLAAAGAAVESWNYNDLGPETWAENFPTCGGDEQSPVNIDANAVDAAIHKLKAERREGRETPGIVVDYDRRATVEVFNNTHTIQVDIPAGGGSFSIGDQTYELLQFHFHAPSEHAFNGELAPMEMHLVHANEKGELAVLGIFIGEGRVNSVLAPIWADLPGVDDPRRIQVDNFQLSRLVPQRPRAVSYMGSLTTPPCTEGVSWYVLGTGREMSEEQIDEFEEIFSGEEFPEGNARPVQPLNDREISVTGRERGR